LRIIGLALDVVVSDPWEFARPDGSVVFEATVAKASTFASGIEEERLLIEFQVPFAWRGTVYRHFVVRPHYGQGLVDDLTRGHAAECSLLAVSDDQARSADPFDISSWRGGLAARATIEPRPTRGSGSDN
jgi:hypothetical protein